MLRKFCLVLLAVYLVGATIWVLASGFTRNEQMLNVACDPTRKLWAHINRAFAAEYEAQTGTRPVIRQSHGGSGSQARAVIDGLPADVVTLALWTDTDAIRKAGLIDAGWEDRFDNRSLPFVSTIVMVVRKGNPKGIRQWIDLARDDVQVITPNPKTSGNGKWSFLALWGAFVRDNKTDAQAQQFVADVYRRAPVLDTSARGATMTFAQKKIGDVHLTWENEAYLELHEAEGELEIVYPRQSILAEPHVAVVDAVARRKGTVAMAEAYLKFLYTEQAQEIIAEQRYRPSNEKILLAHRFPEIELFSVRELGPSWESINARFFAEGGIFDGIFATGAKP